MQLRKAVSGGLHKPAVRPCRGDFKPYSKGELEDMRQVGARQSEVESGAQAGQAPEQAQQQVRSTAQGCVDWLFNT